MKSFQIDKLFERDPDDSAAAQMYLDAFKRLATNAPINLGKGTPVTQNNVAKEAGKDPSALKLSRFPGVIKKIKIYLELTSGEELKKRVLNAKVKKGKLSLKARVSALTEELSESQSKLLSVERRLVEALEETAELKEQLDELNPPPPEIRSAK